MTVRKWQILAGLFVLSALAGLIAGRPGGVFAGGARDSVWADPAPPPDQETFRRDVVTVLARSTLFGRGLEEELNPEGSESGAADDDATAEPFPPIQSAALLDGKPVVYLIVDDRVIAAAPGDVISGNWEILAVSLEDVRAAQSGAEQVFPIFPAEPADPG